MAGKLRYSRFWLPHCRLGQDLRFWALWKRAKLGFLDAGFREGQRQRQLSVEMGTRSESRECFVQCWCVGGRGEERSRWKRARGSRMQCERVTVGSVLCCSGEGWEGQRCKDAQGEPLLRYSYCTSISTKSMGPSKNRISIILEQPSAPSSLGFFLTHFRVRHSGYAALGTKVLFFFSS